MNTQSKHKRKVLEIFAPAKINLMLHITGKRLDGYHLLNSLICFCDIGDIIRIEKHHTFQFNVIGPFSAQMPPEDLASTLASNNLCVRAAKALGEITKKPMAVKITLTKNLPLASGLGGGSADAAATIYGLQDFWGLPRIAPYIEPLLKTLGADVPVCMKCEASWVRGVGDNISPIPDLLEMPILLINPLKPCSTKNVFLCFSGAYRSEREPPVFLNSPDDFLNFLSNCSNDLLDAAQHEVPEIVNILTLLRKIEGCTLSRMSGSGATCFGLFNNENDRDQAYEILKKENPDWWVVKGWVNRARRY